MILFLGSTLALLLAAYVGVCLFYWWFQERFIFVRFRVADSHVFTFNQSFAEVFLDRPDGARLHALHFTVPSPKGIVLYLHGNTGSLRRWGKRAPRFTSLGYDVLMPDYRGYGKSRGQLSEATLQADITAWYEHVRMLHPEKDVVVYGRSLGTGFAVPVAAAHHPRLLILESPFANFTDVARHYLAILPYRWLLRYKLRSDRAMVRVKCPVFIFHGKRDPVVPYSSALRLYAAIPADVHRELVTFAKGYHSDLGGYARFRRKLKAILAESETSTGR